MLRVTGLRLCGWCVCACVFYGSAGSLLAAFWCQYMRALHIAGRCSVQKVSWCAASYAASLLALKQAVGVFSVAVTPASYLLL